jgi:hypothetical protein
MTKLVAFLLFERRTYKMRIISLFGLCGLLALSTARANSPAEEIKSFSEISEVNPNALAGGAIQSQRGATMQFQDGISTEMCYVVLAPADKTAQNLQNWDPSGHPDLGVFQHHDIHFPAREEDFSSLNLAMDKRPIRMMRDETFAVGPDKADFNLSHAEGQALKEILRGGGTVKSHSAEAASAGWKKTLLQRALDFQTGGIARSSPYEMNGLNVKPAGQFHSMLQEQERITDEFKPILQETTLLGSGGVPASSGRFYWDLFDADSSGTISLGVAYVKHVGDKYQIADFEYYVSGSYYVSLTLYEIWPVTINGKAASLIWRGDFFSAPSVSSAHGVERMAYGMIMIQETKKAIHDFQQDMAKAN